MIDITAFFLVLEVLHKVFFEFLTDLTVISKTAFTKIISLLIKEIVNGRISFIKREIIFVNAVFEITVKSVKNSKKTLWRTSRTRKKAVIFCRYGYNCFEMTHKICLTFKILYFLMNRKFELHVYINKINLIY